MLFGPVEQRRKYTHHDVLFDPRAGGTWLLSAKPLARRAITSRMQAWAIPFGYEQKRWARLDEKWWFQVHNPSPTQKVILTYLKPCHLKDLTSRLTSGDAKLISVNDPFKSPRDLFAILGSLPASYLRNWLPVLIIRSQKEEHHLESLAYRDRIKRMVFDENVGEEVVALPTLGLRVHPNKKGAAPWWIEGLKWECWWKSVGYMDGRWEGDVVVPVSLEERGLVWDKDGKGKKIGKGKGDGEDALVGGRPKAAA